MTGAPRELWGVPRMAEGMRISHTEYMNTISLTSSPNRPASRSFPQAIRNRFGCLSPLTLGAVALAITALLGRAATFLIDGPAPLIQLVTLLAVAIGAMTIARRARRGARKGGWNARLSGLALRIGAVQIVFGLATVGLALA